MEIKQLLNGVSGLELADVLLFGTYGLCTVAVLFAGIELATAAAVGVLVTGAYTLMIKNRMQSIIRCTAPDSHECPYKQSCEVYLNASN